MFGPTIARQLPAFAALALIGLLWGCPGEEEPGPVAHFRVEFDTDALNLRLLRDQSVLLSFTSSSLQLGTVPALDDNRSYDPFFPIEEVSWHTMSAAQMSAEGSGRSEFLLRFGDDYQAMLTLVEHEPGRVEVTLMPQPGPSPIAFYRLVPHVDAQEGFYGLGSVVDTPQHRGKVRAMQLELDASVESFNNEAHVPIPLLIGTRGWGLFVEDPHPGLFEVATWAEDRVQVTYGTGMDSAQGFRFHLFAADHPLDITRLYYDTTGDPLLPARWALGPWVWRDENEDEAQVLSDLQTIRDLDLATSAYWIDRPYASGVNTFDFEPALFPDPQGMIDRAHDLGFRMALWHTPYVDPEQSPVLHQEATDGGFFPPQSPNILNRWSAPIDLTNPVAYSWWQDLIRRYTDMGIEGFKLDYAEDVVVGLEGGRLAWQFSDGSDERTMHEGYTRLYHQVYAETLPKDGGFLLCRAGAYGDQVHASVIWPGDLDATMNPHGADASDDGQSYTATGGLPASLVYGLSLGPSGFPFYGADTGGYRHAPPDKETFTRWFQQTALSTVMQVGTNSNDVAWEFEEDNGFDAEMLDWYREFTRLHLRLFPTLWSYAQRLAVDGRAIARPLGLAHPELGIHPAHTYLLGDDLLVAPVVVYGDRERAVPLPAGAWIDWFSGEQYQGPGEVTVAAPLSKLPLFLRGGGIVPLLREGIDTMAPTTLPDEVDSYATDPGLLYARIFPGAASTFVLFDGSELSQEATAGGVTLGYADGSEFQSGALFEVMAMAAPPTSVTLDGSALAQSSAESLADGATGWSWSEQLGGSLQVRVPAGSHEVVVSGSSR
jgi:alpha-D-xyloside xylohydrolase